MQDGPCPAGTCMASGMGFVVFLDGDEEGVFARPEGGKGWLCEACEGDNEAAIASDAAIVVICLDVRLTNLVFSGRASRTLWLPS